jgi:hypothetical protein
MQIDKLVNAIMADLRPAVEKAIKTAYENGEADMRNRLMHVLKVESLPAHIAATTGTAEPVAAPKDQVRAPRGEVGKLITEVLNEEDGLRAVTVEHRVLQRNNRIASKSVGNELRRFKDEKYRQDGRRRWFLIRSDAEKETAGDSSDQTPAASTTSNQGGPNGATLASSG